MDKGEHKVTIHRGYKRFVLFWGKCVICLCSISIRFPSRVMYLDPVQHQQSWYWPNYNWIFRFWHRNYWPSRMSFEQGPFSEILTRFMLCCVLLWFGIDQIYPYCSRYFFGNRATIRFLQDEWSHPDECRQIYHMGLPRTAWYRWLSARLQ